MLERQCSSRSVNIIDEAIFIAASIERFDNSFVEDVRKTRIRRAKKRLANARDSEGART